MSESPPNETDPFVVVLITASSPEEGRRIARSLVEGRWAACVNLIPSIQSIFSWKGEINEESETLLVVKSRRSLYREIENQVKKLHSYEVPEVIALPIVAGSKDYLGWVVNSVGEPKS
jgi:periplasmic divalent cation tolerance protein